jgi:hypothetical protein
MPFHHPALHQSLIISSRPITQLLRPRCPVHFRQRGVHLIHRLLQILYHLIRPSSFPTPASWTIRGCSAFGLAHRLRIKMRIPAKSTKNATAIPAAAPDERPNEGLEVAADVVVMLAAESEPAVIADPTLVMLEESEEAVDVVADVEVFGLAYQAVSPQNPPKNA